MPPQRETWGVSHPLAPPLPTPMSKYSASKNTDSSVFYTEIETKILNTDSDPTNTDRDPMIAIQPLQWPCNEKVIKVEMQTCRTLQK